MDQTIPGRVVILENNEYKITYFESVGTATGTVTKPTGSTILLDQFAGGVDAYVSTIINGQPTGILPKTAGGVEVDVTSFDALGNYTLSGTPSAFPVALIYIIKIKALDYGNLTIDNVIDLQAIPFGYKVGNVPSIGSDLVANELLATDANNSLLTLTTATYPSLTEISYIKGLTSSAQTQLNSKASLTTLNTYTKNGDRNILSLDLSKFRDGSWSDPGVLSGDIYTLAGELVMYYQTHNVSIDSNGNFLGRDETEACQMTIWTESGLIKDYYAASAAAGVVPTWILKRTYTGSTGQLVIADGFQCSTATALTSVTSHLIIGGTGTTSTLSLQPTSGVGTTGADIVLKLGNNGATEGARLLNSGIFRIGTGVLNTTSTSQFQIKGVDGSQATQRTCMTYGNGGFAVPSNVNTESNGDKWLMWNSSVFKGSIGFDSYTMWFQATSSSTQPTMIWYLGNASSPVERMRLTNTGLGINTTTTSNAWLSIAGTTTTLAAIHFESNTLKTTPVPGDLEYYDKHWYITNGARHEITSSSGIKTTNTTVSNTVTETTIYSYVYVANELHQDQQIEVTVSGVITNASAADDYLLNIYLGGVLLHTVSRVGGNVTDEGWDLKLTSTIRNEGAGGTFVDHVRFSEGTLSYSLGEAATHALNTTISNTLEIKVQWTNAKAGNIFVCSQGILLFNH